MPMKSDIRRRDFLRTVTGVGATLGIVGSSELASASDTALPACSEPAFPQVQKLTESVAQFVFNTKYADISADALELGKKSILDGLGLALSGSRAETAVLIEGYVKSFGF